MPNQCKVNEVPASKRKEGEGEFRFVDQTFQIIYAISLSLSGKKKEKRHSNYSE